MRQKFFLGKTKRWRLYERVLIGHISTCWLSGEKNLEMYRLVTEQLTSHLLEMRLDMAETTNMDCRPRLTALRVNHPGLLRVCAYVCVRACADSCKLRPGDSPGPARACLQVSWRARETEGGESHVRACQCWDGRQQTRPIPCRLPMGRRCPPAGRGTACGLHQPCPARGWLSEQMGKRRHHTRNMQQAV